MGCDIHLYVEVFDKETGKWKPDLTEFPNPGYDADGTDWEKSQTPVIGQAINPYQSDYPNIVMVQDDNDNWVEKLWTDVYGNLDYIYTVYYRDRNYSLFAILADVRNGYKPSFNPICDPKGLPYNISQEIATRFKCWGLDAHTPSWLTVSELDTYDWEQTIDWDDGTHKYKEVSGLFYNNVMPMLRALGEPENVRIVFWFDN